MARQETPSPVIQNLTPDLLYEIFSRCLPAQFYGPISCVSPLNLSSVCKSWRDVALGRTSLWASLDLTVFHQHCPDSYAYSETPCTDFIHDGSPQILEAWLRWLEMSGDCPLDIVLDVTMHKAPPAIAEILRVTLEQHNRWRKGDINFLVNIASPVISGIALDFHFPPHLEDFDIRIVNGLQNYIGAKFYHLNMLSASRLANLKILNARSIISRPVGLLGNITAIHTFELNLAALPEILRSAPNLEKFSAGLQGVLDAGEDGLSRFVMSKLKKFSVGIDPDNTHSLSLVLKMLSAPSLTTLLLKCRTREELAETNLWTAAMSFIQRVNPPIETLMLHSRGEAYGFRPRIDAQPTSDGVVTSILESVPNLKQLQIIGAIASSRLFQTLVGSRSEANGGILCPLLRYITRGEEGYDRIDSSDDGMFGLDD